MAQLKLKVSLPGAKDGDQPPVRAARHTPPALRLDSFRRITMSGLLVIALFFGGFGIWSVVAKLSGAIIAQGIVKVDMNRKTVQHREGGIVREILVREGDKVQAGQPLVVLTDAQVDSSVTVLSNQLAMMMARQARLEAQRTMTGKIIWPAELLAQEQAPDVRQIMEVERSILSNEIQALDGQTRLLQEQIVGLHAQVKAEERIIQAYQEELTAKAELQQNKYLEKTPVLELRRNIASHQSVKSVSQQRISEMQMRIVELRKEYLQKATAQLAEIQSRTVELRERLRPTLDAQKRLVVSAPVAGTVMDVTVFTLGAVVTPGYRFMDIVPQDNPLIVEADIQVKDISRVRLGQAAKVQLSAFTQVEAQPFEARIVYVSPDRVVTRGPFGEQPVYKIHAQISQEALAKQNIEMSAGMPAVVYVLVKEKTLLEYILEPITETLSRALRE